jgi:hypothetical protein
VMTADGKIIEKGPVKEFTPFVDGCPSDIFPSAFRHSEANRGF